MGALSKFEPTPTHTGVGKVTVIDGRQAVLLPENVHVDVAELDVVQHGAQITMKPARRRPTRQEIEEHMADLRRDQAELGDILPGGREQPAMPSDDSYPPGFFGDTEP
jgi:virulence-associated protein VagC